MVDIKNQKVVVIGHGSTMRLGVVRAVAELDCEITVIVMTGYWRWTRIKKRLKPFDCYSKYISHLYYCHGQDEEGFIRLLIDKCRDISQKVILLPTTDFTAAVIEDHKDKLSEYFYFPYIADSHKSIRYWMDKLNQKTLARQIGLNIPGSCIIEANDKSYTIPSDINYPCFTKALITIKGGKQLFNRCDNAKELLQALDKIEKKHNVPILVEDYKEIETEYAVLGFSTGKEVVFPGIIKLSDMTVSHFGVAMTGEVMPIQGFESLLDQFKEYVLQIGFVGVFDIDFYYSENKFYFGEINLRFGGSGYAITKMGVNLPAMLIRYFRGEGNSGVKMQIDSTASYVNERMCEDDWCYGRISSEEYRRIVASADISFVRDGQDPMPQRVFEFIHFVHPLKKLLKKILFH